MAHPNEDAEHLDESVPGDGIGNPEPEEDDLLGEAIEEYLVLAEGGGHPDVEAFVARYPGMESDIREALEGLEMIQGLVGHGSSRGSGSGQGHGSRPGLDSGHRIAGYRIVRELGRGGMGTVYEAVHVGLDRPVALKVLGSHAAPDSSARRRFLNEARTAAGLHHTHIVPVFDVGQMGGLCYYAMQRIEGSGLDRVIRHLRRTRLKGVTDSGVRSANGLPLGGGAGSSITSSFGSRFGGILQRVSPEWLWGPRRAAGHGPIMPAEIVPGVDLTASVVRGSGIRDDFTGSWHGAGDVSGSWGHRRALDGVDRLGLSGELSWGGLSGANGLVSTAAKGGRGIEDVTPMFEPPRGSAFFRWVADVGVQAADALAHAHQHGVIHRDVKPSNLLIDPKGSLWVTDFGLARRLADPGMTHHDSLLGTPRYMSPEQARTGTIDGRTDVYSLGATLYELLTLRPPFDGQTAPELLDQIGHIDPIAPKKIDHRVPRDLETIVLKALAKWPDDRYATAGDLADDLGRYLGHQPVKARRISPIGRAWRVACRHPAITAVSTTAAAIVIAVATFAYVSIMKERDNLYRKSNELELALGRTAQANLEKVGEMKRNLLMSARLVGLSNVPNRRSHGLDLVRSAVALDLEPEMREQFRVEAVKLLVLRDVEDGPYLDTGRAIAAAYGPSGNRIAVLNEDADEVSFWQLEQRKRVATLSLRGTGAGGGIEAAGLEGGGERAELSVGVGGAGAGADGGGNGRSGAGVGVVAAASGGRPARRSFLGRRLTVAGNCLAVISPDDRSVQLIDAYSGVPLGTLNRPGHLVVGLVGDAGGRRLITVEIDDDDPLAFGLDGGNEFDGLGVNSAFRVNVWNLDRPEGPPVRLTRGRDTTPWRSRPLVALSADGKTVVVAETGGKAVLSFSAEDGTTIGRPVTVPSEITAIALGANSLLATAGGGAIQLYDLDSRRFLRSLTPSQSITRIMRFSPRGNLLAISGLGPIELWDPVAGSQVSVLRSDQATDLAFGGDGRSLAATARSGGTLVWTLIDSSMRAQLSGFDDHPSSLVFGRDGTLAGGGWNGELWFWRDGRCPAIGPPPVTGTGDVEVAASPVDARVEPRQGPGPRGGPDAAGAERSGTIAMAPRLGGGPAASANRPGPGGGGLPEGFVGPPTYEQRQRYRPGGIGGGGGGRGANFGGRGSDAPANPAQRRTVLAFDDTGRLVVHNAAGIQVWSANSVAARARPIESYPMAAVPPQWLGFLQTARTADGRLMAFLRSAAIVLWNPAEPKRFVTVVPPPRGDEDPAAGGSSGGTRGANGGGESGMISFRAMLLAPAGDRLYLLDQTGRLRIWQLGTKTSDAKSVQATEVRGVLSPAEGASGLALSRDGSILAVGDRGGTVNLLDTKRLRLLGRLGSRESEATSPWVTLAFSPNGTELAVGSLLGTISIWSVARPEQPRLRLELPGHRGIVTSLAYDDQGRRLASSAGLEALVEVWDLDVIGRETERLGLGG